MNIKSDVLFGQRFLSSCGLYTGKLDGLYGNESRKAEDAFNKLFVKCADKYGRFDDRSEAVIATLLPKAQEKARQFLIAAKAFPLDVKLLSGTRTYAEQDKLFAQRPVVTKARGGFSWHNFGIAWDAGVFNGKAYYTGRNAKEDKAYADLAALIMPKVDGLEWGGAWRSIVDKPHYQLSTGKSVSQARALLEAGKPYV